MTSRPAGHPYHGSPPDRVHSHLAAHRLGRLSRPERSPFAAGAASRVRLTQLTTGLRKLFEL